MMFKHSNATLVVVAVCAALIGAATTISACSATHQSAPGPTPTSIGNGNNAAVIQEPNGFRNVAFSCFGSNGVYVTSAAADDSLPSSVFVVPNDPHCSGR